MKSATIPPKHGAPGPGGSSAPSVQRKIATAEAVARHKAQASASTSDSSASAVPAPTRATFLRSFVYAWDGVRYVVRTQRNMRVHLALGVLAIALGIGLRISPVEWAVIFVAIALVLVSEMMNTVVEAVVDLASPRFSPLAKVAKDAAAGAVLLNALLSLVIALFVYVPHLWPVLLRLLGR